MRTSSQPIVPPLSIHHTDGRTRDEPLTALEHLSALAVVARHGVFLRDAGDAIRIAHDTHEVPLQTLAVSVHPCILATFFGARADRWRDMHRAGDVAACVVTLTVRPHA